METSNIVPSVGYQSIWNRQGEQFHQPIYVKRLGDFPHESYSLLEYFSKKVSVEEYNKTILVCDYRSSNSAFLNKF